MYGKGAKAPFLVKYETVMVKENQLETIIRVAKKSLKERGFLLIDIKSDSNYNFKVYIDKKEGNITIDDCVKVSRDIEHSLEEIFEDFSLEVSSPGLTSPFKIKEQYVKNVGEKLDVILANGERFEGVLDSIENDELLFKINNKGRINKKKD